MTKQAMTLTAYGKPALPPSHSPWKTLRVSHRLTTSTTSNSDLTLYRGTVIPFGLYDTFQGGARWSEWVGSSPEIFRKVIPAYGWIQFHWWSLQRYSEIEGWFYPWAGFIISLTPDKDLPYYAYASVVFTPDPDSGVPEFNDPMFIPAEPGYIPPFTEGTSPP